MPRFHPDTAPLKAALIVKCETDGCRGWARQSVQVIASSLVFNVFVCDRCKKRVDADNAKRKAAAA